MKNKVAFIAAHGHTAARDYAKEVCDNSYYMGVPKWIPNTTLRTIAIYFRAIIYSFLIPRHDIYLAHGSPGLLCAVIKKKVFRDGSKIVMRVNDSMFSDYNIKGIKKKFLRLMYKNIDGAIAISDMIKKDIKKELPNIPVETVYCQVRDNDFFDIKPNLKDHNIMCLGTAPNDRKGTSIQLDVYKEMNKEVFTYIMGDTKCIEKICKQKELIEELVPKFAHTYFSRILFTGKSNPQYYLHNCTFLLHPARFDAGGNAVIECMAAGLIPIVSYKTGNSEIVENVDKSLIINSFDSNDYYKKINQLRKLSYDELLSLSNKCKLEALKHSKKRMEGKFKEAFENVTC